MCKITALHIEQGTHILQVPEWCFKHRNVFGSSLDKPPKQTSHIPCLWMIIKCTGCFFLFLLFLWFFRFDHIWLKVEVFCVSLACEAAHMLDASMLKICSNLIFISGFCSPLTLLCAAWTQWSLLSPSTWKLSYLSLPSVHPCDLLFPFLMIWLSLRGEISEKTEGSRWCCTVCLTSWPRSTQSTLSHTTTDPVTTSLKRRRIHFTGRVSRTLWQHQCFPHVSPLLRTLKMKPETPETQHQFSQDEPKWCTEREQPSMEENTVCMQMAFKTSQ